MCPEHHSKGVSLAWVICAAVGGPRGPAQNHHWKGGVPHQLALCIQNDSKMALKLMETAAGNENNASAAPQKTIPSQFQRQFQNCSHFAKTNCFDGAKFQF